MSLCTFIFTRDGFILFLHDYFPKVTIFEHPHPFYVHCSSGTAHTFFQVAVDQAA